MKTDVKPLVVLYLYVHERGEEFDYPTARSRSNAARIACRYLECAVAQAASLRLRRTECDVVLATNITDRHQLGPKGMALMDSLESLNVELLPTQYRHRPGDGSKTYVSSRYVLDAILTAAEGQPEDRQIWLTDLDVVWVDPEKAFTSAPPAGEVGCMVCRYSLDWDVTEFGSIGRSRRAIGELVHEMGGTEAAPEWIGGELITGTPQTLRELVATSERLDAELAKDGKYLPTEEQILSLAGGLGQVHFTDMSSTIRRIQTGTRHHAPPVENPLSLGMWHLPAEKGLSFRRTAQDMVRGRQDQVRVELLDPVRMGRRFKVAGTGSGRQLKDDLWLARQRVTDQIRTRLTASS